MLRAGESGFWGCVSKQRGHHCWCQHLLNPLGSCAEPRLPPPGVPQRLEVTTNASVGSVHEEEGRSWPLVMDSQQPGPRKAHYRRSVCSSQPCPNTRPCCSWTPHPVRGHKLPPGPRALPELRLFTQPVTYQRWKVLLSVGFSQWRFLGP